MMWVGEGIAQASELFSIIESEALTLGCQHVAEAWFPSLGGDHRESLHFTMEGGSVVPTGPGVHLLWDPQ